MGKFLSLLAVLVLFGTLAFSQTKVVTGKIVDEQNQPVPYATVRVKGAQTGVSADAEGKFSIKANLSQTLIISGVGIATKEIVVTDEASLSVSVTRTSTLNEVVVTALGQTRSKNSTPYATQQISGADLTKAPTTNVVNNLSGKDRRPSNYSQ